MLAIPPFGASSNIALWRANIKPPVELVVDDLELLKITEMHIERIWKMAKLSLLQYCKFTGVLIPSERVQSPL